MPLQTVKKKRGGGGGGGGNEANACSEGFAIESLLGRVFRIMLA